MIFLELLCGVVILLLVIAGLAYIIGADKIGGLVLNTIRLIIMIALILVLIGLILLYYGYTSIPGVSMINPLHILL